MLKILWKRKETIFCYLMLDFYIRIRIRFSLQDKQLFEITKVTKVEITRVDCICKQKVNRKVMIMNKHNNIPHPIFNTKRERRTHKNN